MIPTTPGAATTAVLDGAPAGSAITARLVDGDEILPTGVLVSPKLDAAGDALDAFTALFFAPAALPVQIEWFQAGVLVGTELVVLGSAGASSEGTPGYPPTADLVAASTVSELTTLSVPQQDSYREVAISAVERYCGQRFVPSAADVILDGAGARELYPPVHIEALTGVVVKGTSIDLTDIVVSARGDRIYFGAFDTSYAVMAMREVAYDTRTFRSGAGTVILSGTFGWTLCPPAVFEALRIEMETQATADASQMSGIVASYRRLGLRDISQGNLRASIGDPSTISPQAAALLHAYIWTGQGGELV